MTIANLLKSLSPHKERSTTISSAGDLIEKYGIFELVKPNWESPCFAYKTKNKPLSFLKEVEIPNQHLKALPLKRVPWNLPSQPEAYESTEKLFEDIKDCLYRHLETPKPEDLNVIAAYVMLTWILEKFETTPYLFFYGIFESGKSRALEMLHQLCYRAWIATDVTPSNLFRPIEAWRPTLLLDESETFIGKPEIIGLLNSGYKRGNCVPRQQEGSEGYTTEWYDLFCPKALSGTEDLIRTTRSRCIVIPMQKATRQIPIFIDKQQTAKLRNQLLQFRFDIFLSEDSEASEGSTEEGLKQLTENLTSGRLIELFIPLYVVTPAKYKKEILDYARTVNEERNINLSTSEEVIVLQAILQCQKEGVLNGKLLLIKDITEKLNIETDFNDQYSNQKVGNIVSRIGFQKQHTNKGNCLIWNERLIEKLKTDARYKSAFQPTEIGIPNPLKPSQGSHGSPTKPSIDANDYLKNKIWINDAKKVPS